MENALKKLSAEIKANLEAAMSSTAVKDLIASTKAAEDSGTFEVVVSTADFDRSGESVDPTGMDFSMYKMNPIVLWGHDYYALPIGVCDSIEIVEGKIVAKGRFAPADANPFAQQVRKLYDAKIVRATSIGFIVKEMNGKIITKGELLEFSFVPVPANPYALSLSAAKTLGLDVAMLAMKGLNSLMKKEEGDAEVEETIEEAEAEAIVEETPAGDEEVATTTEEKGAISDEIVEGDMWEQKWNKLEAVNDIMNAFYDVYLNEDTPVEDFETLVAELATLLAGVAGTAEADIEKAQKAKTLISEKRASTDRKTFVRTKADDVMIQAVGAELASMQASLDTTATDSAAKIMAILNGGDAEEAEAEEGDEKSIADGDTPESVAITEEVKSVIPDVFKELNEFEGGRLILRALATATSNALENYNKKSRAFEEAK